MLSFFDLRDWIVLEKNIPSFNFVNKEIKKKSSVIACHHHWHSLLAFTAYRAFIKEGRFNSRKAGKL